MTRAILGTRVKRSLALVYGTVGCSTSFNMLQYSIGSHIAYTLEQENSNFICILILDTYFKPSIIFKM
jgi:hypothetical protein